MSERKNKDYSKVIQDEQLMVARECREAILPWTRKLEESDIDFAFLVGDCIMKRATDTFLLSRIYMMLEELADSSRDPQMALWISGIQAHLNPLLGNRPISFIDGISRHYRSVDTENASQVIIEEMINRMFNGRSFIGPLPKIKNDEPPDDNGIPAAV